MFQRAMQLPPAGQDTFFLWGPRQTGKTTLLKSAYPDAYWVDLLKADEFRRYIERPELLRAELTIRNRVGQVVIDEVQKVPALLDEVHWLHENTRFRFALCGSSARKVRRGGANLLGGRALRYKLFGLTSCELSGAFDLTQTLNQGYLPSILFHTQPHQRMAAYVGDYLKEEIAAEGLVRNLPVFSHFLDIAALSDGDRVNFSTIARECGVSNQSIKGYFEILTDTLLGSWLSAYRRRPKRRVILAPKFYFADVGVVNFLAKRGKLEPGSELFGKAFENWLFHELTAHRSYSADPYELSYWRLPSGIEVDFVLGDMRVAVEAKASRRIASDHLKGLRELHKEHKGLKRRIVVCLEPKARRTEDGIEVLPASEFARQLWAGEVSAS